MPTTRRQFIKRGAGLVTVGMVMPESGLPKREPRSSQPQSQVVSDSTRRRQRWFQHTDPLHRCALPRVASDAGVQGDGVEGRPGEHRCSSRTSSDCIRQ